jgi:hypothetical protein
MRRTTSALLALSALLATGCSFRDQAANENFQGMKDMHGNAVTHMNYSRLGLNLFFSKPWFHDPSLEATVMELTSDAKEAGNTKIRIVQSDSSTYWWCFPPFSFIITPAMSNVAADVSK